MSREIKFRAWLKGRMVYITPDDDYFIDGDGRLVKIEQIENGCNYQGFEDYECNLMQYTGLKDKHGKEIYEGDIVKFHYKRVIYKIGPVVWNDMFGSWDIDCTDFVAYKSLGKFNSVSEVIGNIYENPELLEETA